MLDGVATALFGIGPRLVETLAKRPEAGNGSMRAIARRPHRLTPDPEAGQRKAGLAATYFDAAFT
jgi:hypothetical protein